MKPTEIGAFEAKTHLSKLLQKVRQGKSFTITHRGRPLAELRPVTQPKKHPRFGSYKDKIIISPNFDDPIPGMEEYS